MKDNIKLAISLVIMVVSPALVALILHTVYLNRQPEVIRISYAIAFSLGELISFIIVLLSGKLSLRREE